MCEREVDQRIRSLEERAEYFAEWRERVSRLLMEMPVEILNSEEGTSFFETAQVVIEKLDSAAKITIKEALSTSTD